MWRSGHMFISRKAKVNWVGNPMSPLWHNTLHLYWDELCQLPEYKKQKWHSLIKCYAKYRLIALMICKWTYIHVLKMTWDSIILYLLAHWLCSKSIAWYVKINLQFILIMIPFPMNMTSILRFDSWNSWEIFLATSIPRPHIQNHN